MAGQISLPSGWSTSKLSGFIQQAFENSVATFVKCNPSFTRLEEIHKTYQRAIDNLHNTPDWFCVFFILMANSSFLGASHLATGGQISETQAILRTCLEHSLYGFFLSRNPKMAQVWLKRHDSEKTREKVREEFRIGRMMQLLRSEDSKLYKVANALYEKTIDLGAHPNEQALMSRLRQTDTADNIRFDLEYLVADPVRIEHALRTTAQVGICSLRIFQWIFPERFKLLGITDDIRNLSRGL